VRALLPPPRGPMLQGCCSIRLCAAACVRVRARALAHARPPSHHPADGLDGEADRVQGGQLHLLLGPTVEPTPHRYFCYFRSSSGAATSTGAEQPLHTPVWT